MSDVLLMEHVGPAGGGESGREAARARREERMGDSGLGIAEDRFRKPRYTYACLGFGGRHGGAG